MGFVHSPDAESVPKQNAAGDSSVGRGSSFCLGFENRACGESNIRKSVLTLPPSLSLKLLKYGH